MRLEKRWQQFLIKMESSPRNFSHRERLVKSIDWKTFQFLNLQIQNFKVHEKTFSSKSLVWLEAASRLYRSLHKLAKNDNGNSTIDSLMLNWKTINNEQPLLKNISRLTIDHRQLHARTLSYYFFYSQWCFNIHAFFN